MKALELVVYPPFEHDWNIDKRLTDAELAAEFYKSVNDHYAANSMHMMFEDGETEQAMSDARDWMFCMERFATLPHYDEERE